MGYGTGREIPRGLFRAGLLSTQTSFDSEEKLGIWVMVLWTRAGVDTCRSLTTE